MRDMTMEDKPGIKTAEEKNIVKHPEIITKEDRRRLNGHHSFVLWFTGLSASGKSTLAFNLEAALHKRGIRTYVLDGDNVRHGLNHDLGFSPNDRKENIRRLGEVSKLFNDAGVVVLSAFISPYKADRESVRKIIGDNEFLEIHVDCPIEVCELRDPKGLYSKARKGMIKEFTGISAPYEAPENPALKISTHLMSVEESVNTIIDHLKKNKFIGDK